MKVFALALAAGIMAASAFNATEAEAGRIGFHFNPIFLPKPHYYGPRHTYRSYDYEDLYDIRDRRRMRSQRALEVQRRRAAAAQQKQELARFKAAKAAERRQTAKQEAMREKVAAAKVEAVAAPPPLPARNAITASSVSIPTEALLTQQETGDKSIRASVSLEQSEAAMPAAPVGLGCKQFLPSAGITISVPCSN